jgi:hypothetical protein
VIDRLPLSCKRWVVGLVRAAECAPLLTDQWRSITATALDPRWQSVRRSHSRGTAESEISYTKGTANVRGFSECLSFNSGHRRGAFKYWIQQREVFQKGRQT